ncbi:MAG: protein-export chaperone SecB [Gammaproteobacteria bacterium]|nr:MAG: protein-export chaperone SecB [Gammaproteobacteria bacterium]
MAENQQAGQEQPRQAQFGIHKIYIKDVSYEAPGTPMVFQQELKPGIDVQLSTESTKLNEEGVHEVVLTVTVTVKHDDTTIYLVEVKQAGIFAIMGLPEEQLPAIIATACPNVLYPYAREVISDLVTKGGFPQLLLAPVNFEVIYAQQQKEQEQVAAAMAEQQGGEAAPH